MDRRCEGTSYIAGQLVYTTQLTYEKTDENGKRSKRKPQCRMPVNE